MAPTKHVAISERGRKVQLANEKRLVYLGFAQRTSSGLRKKDIMRVVSPKGVVRYVSRRKHLQGKAQMKAYKDDMDEGRAKQFEKKEE